MTIPAITLPLVNVGTTSGDHTGDGSTPGTGQVPFQKVNAAISQLNAITATLTASPIGGIGEYVAITYGDTVRTQAPLNSVAGTTVINFGQTVPGNYLGATIVVTGIGQLVVANAQNTFAATTGGTGYAAGDTITLGGGTFSTAAVLSVLAVSGGAITMLSVQNGGNYSVWPGSNAFTQGSTSGSGSGATFTIPPSALPLATTIAAINGNNLTLSAVASLTLTGVSNWIYYGHDDAPAIQAAISSGSSLVALPPNRCYGIRSPLLMSSSFRQILEGNGSTLVALDPMAQMIYTTGSFWLATGSSIRNLEFEGAGVANVCLQQGGAWWTHDNCFYRNALVQNVYVKNNAASVPINNQWRAIGIYNDPIVLPNGSNYLIQLASNGTDNHFTDVIGLGGQLGAVLDATFGTYYTNIHTYGIVNGHHFQLTGGAYHTTGLYADNPYGNYAGIYIHGSSSVITGWYVFVNSSNLQTQLGVWIQQGTSNVVCNGVASGLASTANGCVTSGGSGALGNYFFNNTGCSFVLSPIYQPANFQTFSGGGNPSGTVGIKGVQYTGTGGSFITLPTLSAGDLGQIFVVTNIGTGSCTVAGGIGGNVVVPINGSVIAVSFNNNGTLYWAVR